MPIVLFFGGAYTGRCWSEHRSVVRQVFLLWGSPAKPVNLILAGDEYLPFID